MGTRRRYDGTLIQNLPPFRRINPFVMRGRNESAIYYAHLIDLEGTRGFLGEHNRQRGKDEQVSLFHVILCAAVRVIAERPQLNRFVTGQRIYQRNRIQVSFIVKKELSDDGPETNAKVTFSPYETLESCVGKINRAIEAARRVEGNPSDREIGFVTKLPRILINGLVEGWRFLDHYGIAPRKMIDLDPLYTSVYVANLGSVGLDAPFHHLYEWGNASIFVVIGRPRRHLIDTGGGNFESRLAVELKYTLDDRISEGLYAARALSRFRQYVQDPSLLLTEPDLDPETLAELALVDSGEPV
ncbi:MAG: hypothetical protein ACOC28_06210 [Alkalispirochaetaceae bacterium]